MDENESSITNIIQPNSDFVTNQIVQKCTLKIIGNGQIRVLMIFIDVLLVTYTNDM